jgi:NADH-quinone oxidoreductase subunit K
MTLLTIFENPHITINDYIAVSTVLFTIGVLGVLYRRNAITIFMCIELMFFTMAVAAAEVAVGLAILVTIFRNIHSVDIDELKNLKN